MGQAAAGEAGGKYPGTQPSQAAQRPGSGLTPVHPCALPSWLLLLLHPVLSNHSQKAGGARTGGARPQCTEVTPAGDMTLTRAEKPSRTSQGPIPRHSEPLGLAYILCLGTGLLLPGLSFPVCTTMARQADAISPFQAREDAGPWPLMDNLRFTCPQPHPSPLAGL